MLDVTSVYLTQSSFILSVLLRVFQVRKHNLISALVADPYRGDTIRRLTRNGRILLPADEIDWEGATVYSLPFHNSWKKYLVLSGLIRILGKILLHSCLKTLILDQYIYLHL